VSEPVDYSVGSPRLGENGGVISVWG